MKTIKIELDNFEQFQAIYETYSVLQHVEKGNSITLVHQTPVIISEIYEDGRSHGYSNQLRKKYDDDVVELDMYIQGTIGVNCGLKYDVHYRVNLK